MVSKRAPSLTVSKHFSFGRSAVDKKILTIFSSATNDKSHVNRCDVRGKMYIGKKKNQKKKSPIGGRVGTERERERENNKSSSKWFCLRIWGNIKRRFTPGAGKSFLKPDKPSSCLRTSYTVYICVCARTRLYIFCVTRACARERRGSHFGRSDPSAHCHAMSSGRPY